LPITQVGFHKLDNCQKTDSLADWLGTLTGDLVRPVGQEGKGR